MWTKKIRNHKQFNLAKQCIKSKPDLGSIQQQPFVYFAIKLNFLTRITKIHIRYLTVMHILYIRIRILLIQYLYFTRLQKRKNIRYFYLAQLLVKNIFNDVEPIYFTYIDTKYQNPSVALPAELVQSYCRDVSRGIPPPT